MDLSDAVTLLWKVSGVAEQDRVLKHKLAENIVDRLGCLALAICQAGAVLQKRSYTMVEYYNVFDQRRKELLQERGAQSLLGYQHTIYTAWDLSVKAIKEQHSAAAPDAVEVLHVF
ncbi:MAG: hypothetical protein Q9162_007887, partial [Coniocarpon cinnabarinum]